MQQKLCRNKQFLADSTNTNESKDSQIAWSTIRQQTALLKLMIITWHKTPKHLSQKLTAHVQKGIKTNEARLVVCICVPAITDAHDVRDETKWIRDMRHHQMLQTPGKSVYQTDLLNVLFALEFFISLRTDYLVARVLPFLSCFVFALLYE